MDMGERYGRLFQFSALHLLGEKRYKTTSFINGVGGQVCLDNLSPETYFHQRTLSWGAAEAGTQCSGILTRVHIAFTKHGYIVMERRHEGKPDYELAETN